MFWTGLVEENRTTGGLRIKKITTSDGVGYTEDMIKTYTYTDGNGLSTGRLFNDPKYGFKIIEDFGCSLDYLAIFSSGNFNDLNSFEGHHIAYEMVTEHNNGAGKTEYEFFFEENTAESVFPSPRSEVRLKAGNLKSTTIYEQGKTSSLAFTEYTPVSDIYQNVNGLAYTAYSIDVPDDCQLAKFRIKNNYQLKTGIYRLDNSRVKKYSTHTVTSYEYDGSLNRVYAPIKIRMTNSDGKVHETQNVYTFQMDQNSSNSPANIKDELLNRNIIGPYKIIKKVGSNQVDISETTFGFFDQ
ncbi:MAG: hypothetical protein AAGK97_18030, partial [Bacteroidota bacterium]